MIPVYITNYPSKEVSIMWSIESEGNYICPKCRRAALRLGNDLPENYCIDCDKNSSFYDEDGDLLGLTKTKMLRKIKEIIYE